MKLALRVLLYGYLSVAFVVLSARTATDPSKPKYAVVTAPAVCGANRFHAATVGDSDPLKTARLEKYGLVFPVEEGEKVQLVVRVGDLMKVKLPEHSCWVPSSVLVREPPGQVR